MPSPNFLPDMAGDTKCEYTFSLFKFLSDQVERGKARQIKLVQIIRMIIKKKVICKDCSFIGWKSSLAFPNWVSSRYVGQCDANLRIMTAVVLNFDVVWNHLYLITQEVETSTAFTMCTQQKHTIWRQVACSSPQHLGNDTKIRPAPWITKIITTTGQSLMCTTKSVMCKVNLKLSYCLWRPNYSEEGVSTGREAILFKL